jgi:hypothetical protein
MSLEEKKAALKKGSDFNRDNAENIRFDPNIPVTVILPADWIKDFKQDTRTTTDSDGNEREYVVSLFKVMNPNAADPKRLRTIKASESLYSEINTVIESALELGWEGPIIMRIEKKVTGGNTYGKWSVQGKEFKEQPSETEAGFSAMKTEAGE